MIRCWPAVLNLDISGYSAGGGLVLQLWFDQSPAVALSVPVRGVQAQAGGLRVAPYSFSAAWQKSALAALASASGFQTDLPPVSESPRRTGGCPRTRDDAAVTAAAVHPW
jgi:hypothetical protein